MSNELLKKKKNKMDVFEWICFVVITLYTLSLFAVLGFGVLNSFKHWFDFESGNVLGLPGAKYGTWTLENYIHILTKFRVLVLTDTGSRYVYIEEMLYNSIMYAVMMSFFGIATQVMVAYACAKYQFKFNSLLYTTAVIVMMIPIVGSLPSEMKMATTLNLKNSFVGMAVMCCRYPGIYFLVFYASFKNVSSSYMEAAEIDGAGHLSIFLTIMLPMIMNTISAVFVLQFIANFNNYMTPMLFLPQRTTVAYGLYMYNNNVDTSTHVTNRLAACIATAIPLMILFFILKDKIMGNVAVGGLKG